MSNKKVKLITIISGLLAMEPSQGAVHYAVTHLEGTDSPHGVPVYSPYLDINNRGQMIKYSREVLPHVTIYSYIRINDQWINIKGLPPNPDPAPFRSLSVIDLNDKGQVLGLAPTGANWHGFLATFSKVKDKSGNWIIKQFNRDLGDGITANAINDKGQIVGSNGHAFLDTNGYSIDLGTLAGDTGSSVGNSVNNCGQVTGESSTTNNESHAFVTTHLHKGGMRDLGTLSGSYSVGKSINDSGQVTGNATVINNDIEYTHAFVTDKRFMRDLGTLGGNNSYANKINTNGQVVGKAEVADGSSHAFTTINGVMMDLNNLIDPKKLTDPSTIDPTTGLPKVLNLKLENASSINDKGEILAAGYSSTGLYSYHTFLLTPIRKYERVNKKNCQE
jgi:probable HAF family extracellular repeat protein